MGLETLTRTSKVLYEEKYFEGERQLFEALFRNEDSDESAGVLIDTFTQSLYAVAYRDKDNQAHVRNYQPGSGTLYEPPIAGEKTPIDESLRDEAVDGVEANAGFAPAMLRKVDKIVGVHDAAHKMTKNKQAIDVLLTGVFNAKGIDAADLDLDEDFGRAAGNTLTYDFTAGGATVDEALKNIADQLDAQGTPREGRALLLGKDWQLQIESDTTVLEKMKANTANVLIRQNLQPPLWAGVEGLEWLGEYRPAGCSSVFQLFSYNPGVPYKASSGASAAPWVPDAEVAAFSFSDQTWRVYRGIDIVEDGMIERAVGEVVFDSYVSNEPVAEFLRSQTRHLFIYGNINHTVKSTGTFS